MNPDQVKGTEGYSNYLEEFIKATVDIDFFDLHKDFLPYIPKEKGFVLDLGGGIGRDAFIFSKMGHSVITVEPLEEFRSSGSKLYSSDKIIWIDDSLPDLIKLSDYNNHFDFILASGVWHHLNEEEQLYSIKRVSELLKSNAIFALSLRNGPVGVGTYVFPTNAKINIDQALKFGLNNLLIIENQPSLMKNKKDVTWTRLVFQKI
ncbi:class I SAM-dependent methyltransferase [Leptospira haakeii]|uniref:SAM-dependent methyltransferase n=1 Tax=Leptospira haakeii TaxID=2023198 RepID=A0ABX4PQG2_9LEPT|nr:methyltransferase domain-containing protein [Leptospira haakeii]PKA18035.1 SAM-dependent methyltransferase [Leptospira haakeii]PKA21848.1 SAM-dependent methyltransferase [Leptospira haakeii]